MIIDQNESKNKQEEDINYVLQLKINLNQMKRSNEETNIYRKQDN